MDRLFRYYYTLSTLRPVQIYGRLWFRLYRPSIRQGDPPTVRTVTGNWEAPACRLPSMSGPESFTFLSHTAHLTGPASWNDPAQAKLWLYNLHYFDDLNAAKAEERTAWHQAFIERWVRENPPTAGNGWEPYPTSLRLVNWIKWALAGNPLPPAAVESLASQAHHLAQRLEYHLLGNHIFVNAKALIFAGTFFQGPEADGWRRTGLRILEREIREQVLPDGGHFELSPMYHSLILEDLLDLYNLARAYPNTFSAEEGKRWEGVIGKMRRWLKVMCHPDGEIAFFNDAAWEISPNPAELEAYAARLRLGPCEEPVEGITHLKESGYIRLQRGPAVALLDVGEIGPRYLPGHAHADTLSFELSLFGKRVLVNSGTSTYKPSPQRERERATTAHNTVVVDGADSSEVWASFRVARRARPLGLEVEERGEGRLIVRCAHDGYRRLPSRTIHRREWSLSTEELTVRDSLEHAVSSAPEPKPKSVARFHCSPEVVVVSPLAEAYNPLKLTIGEHLVRWESGKVPIVVEPAQFHPQFGGSRENRCITVPILERSVAVHIRWEG